MFGLSLVYISDTARLTSSDPVRLTGYMNYNFSFFGYILKVGESDVSVGGIVFHKHYYYFLYIKICMILLFGLFVKLN